MGVSGAAGLGQNIRQTTGLLSRWWSLAYDGEWFPRFLAARSMLGTAGWSSPFGVLCSWHSPYWLNS